jgi:hypothetical protein
VSSRSARRRRVRDQAQQQATEVARVVADLNPWGESTAVHVARSILLRPTEENIAEQLRLLTRSFQSGRIHVQQVSKAPKSP